MGIRPFRELNSLTATVPVSVIPRDSVNAVTCRYAEGASLTPDKPSLSRSTDAHGVSVKLGVQAWKHTAGSSKTSTRGSTNPLTQ